MCASVLQPTSLKARAMAGKKTCQPKSVTGDVPLQLCSYHRSEGTLTSHGLNPDRPRLYSRNNSMPDSQYPSKYWYKMQRRLYHILQLQNRFVYQLRISQHAKQRHLIFSWFSSELLYSVINATANATIANAIANSMK